MRHRSRSLLFILLCLLSVKLTAAESTSMTLHNVLQAVIEHYPSVENALLQVQRARLNVDKAQAQLGWRLNAQAGINRDVSLFGTSTDVLSVGGSVNRLLDSGATVGINANISRSDSEDSFPGVANPSTATSIDLNYRQPLAKGADNPAYEEALRQSELDVIQADAQRIQIYDQLAEQIIALYSAALATQARQANIEQAISRSLRRQRYLEDRTELGVAEQQDLLQVDAQLKSQTAELRALQVVWQSQRIQMNRLMGRPANAELKLMSTIPMGDAIPEIRTVREQAVQRHPGIKQIDSRIQLADSVIRLRQDADDDQLDLVAFIGNRTQSGDTNPGSTSESELVGGVRLEFQKSYDKRASRTDIEQAMIDKDSALIERRQLLEDIEYDAARLLAEIRTGRDALQAYQASVRSEQAKLREAEQRYRTGRSDTEQLLAFESQLSGAELAAELQNIELMSDHLALMLLQGELWKGIRLPESQAETVR